MTPRPLTESDREMLARVIAKRWPACCAEAEARGLDARVTVLLQPSGELCPFVAGYSGGNPDVPASLNPTRALALLADDLEHDPNLCLDVAREPGKPPRVLGWAMARGLFPYGSRMVPSVARIVDLDIRHPARLARDDRIHRERMARLDEAMGNDTRQGDAKRRW